MAEIIKINIELNRDREKLLSIPEIIEVPQFSIVQWNITNFRDLDYYYRYEYGLIFTLYFDKQSPFPWTRQFRQLNRFPYPEYANRLQLAEEVASEKGDFKYGVRMSTAENDETIYDEDPRLIVY